MKKIFSLFVVALFSVSMFADTYTVAGSSVPLFGSSWSQTDTNNDMELVSGTSYQLVKTGKELSAGDIQYKVVLNHAWMPADGGGSYPDNDATLNIPESGIYTVTFTFDASSHEVNATAQKTGDAVVIPTMAVKGGWDSWTVHTLAKAANNETASVTVSIGSVATYEFGLEKDGAWQANGATLTRDANSSSVSGSGSNMKLDADAIGDYVFTWTYATNTLTVTYPAANPDARPTVQMKGSWDEWANFVDLELETTERKIATVTKTLDAGNYSFKMIIGGAWRSKDWNINREYNVVEDITTNPDQNINLNADVAGNYVFTWTYATNTLSVTYPTATGLDNVAANENVVKSIENGQLVIIKYGVKYNAQGAVVK